MDLRRILTFPAAYRLFIHSIAGNYRTVYVNNYVQPKPGDRILDIGCGPGDILAHLPPVEYLGSDISEKYIRAARARFGARGTFVCKALQDMVIDEPASYDRVLANGLIHHLDDREALELFHLAKVALKPEGKLITFDGCYVPEQSTVARLMAQMDRGKYVRTVDGYVDLASRVFPRVQTSIRHDLLRIPYTHIIMECSA